LVKLIEGKSSKSVDVISTLGIDTLHYPKFVRVNIIICTHILNESDDVGSVNLGSGQNRHVLGPSLFVDSACY